MLMSREGSWIFRSIGGLQCSNSIKILLLLIQQRLYPWSTGLFGVSRVYDSVLRLSASGSNLKSAFEHRDGASTTLIAFSSAEKCVFREFHVRVGITLSCWTKTDQVKVHIGRGGRKSDAARPKWPETQRLSHSTTYCTVSKLATGIGRMS